MILHTLTAVCWPDPSDPRSPAVFLRFAERSTSNNSRPAIPTKRKIMHFTAVVLEATNSEKYQVQIPEY